MTMTSSFGQAWNVLPWLFVNKDIPPGWGGPGTERTFKSWLEDLKRWKHLNSYDNDSARIAALELRVAEDVKEKIGTFGDPPHRYRPGDAHEDPMATHH